MRDKKRNQKRVLARRTAAPRAGEGKDFLVCSSPTPLFGFRGMGEISSSFFFSFLAGVLRLVQPLEGGPGKKLRKVQQPEEPENTATVVYIGHIPHGFYEDEMQGMFPSSDSETLMGH
jgi:nucleolar protein 15